MDMQERYIATLLGCALGDTLGMPVEGWKREQIRKYIGKINHPIDPVIITDPAGNRVTEDEFGKLKCWTEGLKKGEYTDDTILTLAIAESIAERRKIVLSDIAKKHVEAYQAQPKLENKVSGSFGKTTLDAIHNLITGISPKISAPHPGGPGNAPPMKMSPVGLFMYATNFYQEGLESALKIGQMTHRYPPSLIAGVVQAHAVYLLLDDVHKHDFLQLAIDISREYELQVPKGEKQLSDIFTWIYRHQKVNEEFAHNHIKSSSHVLQSYPFAVFMFQKYWDDPLTGLRETVNFGGDCDTTGAIFGALAGARHGHFYPNTWVNQLQNKNRLIKAARGIYALKK